jgi:hemerythrin-like domain-containing protein
MKATQQLKDDHEFIQLMLDIIEKIDFDLENGKALNMDHYSKIIEFLKGFADKCHHVKEEEILFPAMVKHGLPNEGGPIAVMLQEHQLGRDYIKSLSDAFDDYKRGSIAAINDIISSSMDYVELLRNHIQKENDVLFMMADKILNESEQEKISIDFELMEEKKMGVCKHEKYYKWLKELERFYLQ